MRKAWLAAALGGAAALAATTARDARACGGCFHPPTESGTVITDHRMIFAVSPQQTTLYDEIEYQGAPSTFAWVLPIHGTVTVGLSSDILFQAIDQATTTTIEPPTLPTCPSCACGGSSGLGAPLLQGSATGEDAGVTVLGQQVVGPYDTVQLASTDPTALTTWLTANGYSIPTDVSPILDAYVSEGFNFLAMRLAPGQGVEAMRPVSVTSAGAGLSLPLRMVAAGTGATVGITLWVVASGRYEPMNFPTFTIAGTDLTWDWSANGSNYTTVRAAKEAALDNAAWQIESSLTVAPIQIEDVVLGDPASADYLPVPAPGQDDAGADDSGITATTETAEAVRQQDLATCFPGGDATEIRVTRMRTDLSRAALANDLTLQAAADQSEMSNFYQVTNSVNAPPCPAFEPSSCMCDASSSGVSTPGEPAEGTSDAGNGTSTPASPGQQSFGCSASPNDSGDGGLGLGLAGLFGAALVRSRIRRKR
jgi:MYXO-CTERM domain-containing protein